LTLFETMKSNDPKFQLGVFEKMERFLQITILKILSENKPLNKEAIYKNLDARLGYQLNQCLVDSLLDTLWFEEMIKTENRKGKCAFSLTNKGIKTINIKNVGLDQDTPSNR
jgi:hypothetical protein